MPETTLAADLAALQHMMTVGGLLDHMRQPTTAEKKQQARTALPKLVGWMGRSQFAALSQGMRGEEWEFFADKAIELAGIIEAMPETYSTAGQGRDAVAHLRYFAGGQAAWYITEKDKGSPDDAPEDFQSQAFGLADLFGDGGELGYINIGEIIKARGELDFYWTPKPLKEIE